jgi:ribosome maturation factor RimP
MISIQTVQALIDEKLAETNAYLVDLSVSSSNQIRVEIDHLEGLGIDECVALSRHIESSLDRDAEDFELQVSSPGLDQPFKVIQQYKKNIGREVSLTKVSGEKIKGLLTGVNNDTITIEYTTKERIEGKKKKEVIEHKEEIQLSEIKETRIIISFK